jgi:hypothetical protein
MEVLPCGCRKCIGGRDQGEREPVQAPNAPPRSLISTPLRPVLFSSTAPATTRASAPRSCRRLGVSDAAQSRAEPAKRARVPALRGAPDSNPPLVTPAAAFSAPSGSSTGDQVGQNTNLQVKASPERPLPGCSATARSPWSRAQTHSRHPHDKGRERHGSQQLPRVKVPRTRPCLSWAPSFRRTKLDHSSATASRCTSQRQAPVGVSPGHGHG